MGPRIAHIVFAMAISPLTVAIVIMVFAGLEPLLFPNLSFGTSFWLAATFFAVPIAYGAIVLVGLPTHLILCRLGRSTVVNHVLVGLGIALIPIAGMLVSKKAAADDVVFLSLIIVCAVTVALVFGLITVTFYEKGAPDSGPTDQNG